MALLSVLMPVYDCDQFVQAAIDSILNQTFRDFEFIIIDDGSKDRTAEIVEAAAARDPRIRVISRENRGIVPSLNEALEQATGTLVARMDGDDISLPDRFSRQVAYLQANPECGLVGTQIMFMDPDGRPIAPMPNPLGHDDDWQRRDIAPHCPVPTRGCAVDQWLFRPVQTCRGYRFLPPYGRGDPGRQHARTFAALSPAPQINRPDSIRSSGRSPLPCGLRGRFAHGGTDAETNRATSRRRCHRRSHSVGLVGPAKRSDAICALLRPQGSGGATAQLGQLATFLLRDARSLTPSNWLKHRLFRLPPTR